MSYDVVATSRNKSRFNRKPIDIDEFKAVVLAHGGRLEIDPVTGALSVIGEAPLRSYTVRFSRELTARIREVLTTDARRRA